MNDYSILRFPRHYMRVTCFACTYIKINIDIYITYKIFIWFLYCLSPIGLQLQSHVGINIWSLWSETPSINHTNYPSPCNIYDNAANDTALIASISHLFWWSDTQIRKKPVSSRRCSHSIHHHLAFVCDECYIYGALFQLSLPLCHCSSAVHVKSGFCLVNSNCCFQMQLFFNSLNCVCPVNLYVVCTCNKI